MQKPSRRSLAIGLIPFVGMCFSVPLWDRVQPMVFGLPFNFFWLLLWIVVSSLCLGVANQLDAGRNREE
jgi:membrane protein required for beta-lactamase induction